MPTKEEIEEVKRLCRALDKGSHEDYLDNAMNYHFCRPGCKDCLLAKRFDHDGITYGQCREKVLGIARELLKEIDPNELDGVVVPRVLYDGFEGVVNCNSPMPEPASFTELPKNVEIDLHNNWVWTLKKGDRVWVAVEEPLACASRFEVELLEQTGVDEFKSPEEIFVPHEMEVVEHYVVSGGDATGHVVSLSYVEPKLFHKLKFVSYCNTRELNNLFVCCHDKVIAPRVFRTKDECVGFCNTCNSIQYNEDRCNDIVAALKGMIQRVEKLRDKCREIEVSES